MTDEEALATLDSVYRLDVGLPGPNQLSSYRPGHCAYNRSRVQRAVLGGTSRAAAQLSLAMISVSNGGDSHRFYQDIFLALDRAVDCLRVSYRAHLASIPDGEFVDCLKKAYLDELKCEGEPPPCIVQHSLAGLQPLMFEVGGLFEYEGFSAEVRMKRAYGMQHLIVSILRLMVAMKRDILRPRGDENARHL